MRWFNVRASIDLLEGKCFEQKPFVEQVVVPNRDMLFQFLVLHLSDVA